MRGSVTDMRGPQPTAGCVAQPVDLDHRARPLERARPVVERAVVGELHRLGARRRRARTSPSPRSRRPARGSSCASCAVPPSARAPSGGADDHPAVAALAVAVDVDARAAASRRPGTGRSTGHSGRSERVAEGVGDERLDHDARAARDVRATQRSACARVSSRPEHAVDVHARPARPARRPAR